MRNQKYLFLFQNDINHSFLPEKDRMDTERIVAGPKQCALMFWHRNIVFWFVYSLLKTFSSYVLTLKSLIWVQIRTLGLFLSQNEILILIWRIKLSLHFGKPKVPIFVPKCYTALIFAPKGPYGQRKDDIWTKTQFLHVLTQKYCISVPKVSVSFVYTIPLLFTKNFFSHVLTSKSLIWVQMITPGLFWIQNEILV